ncbi:uncharacterized protein LOC131682309 [Topomyia yanbarensis]|uniref:uncharacterized protein LOC131682309 n=1 Tax=Topomyia yanbarensis TaxID=2498891 RepID=UPI00273B6F1F|nr:uncharacterized protein LOC131682309 [Topomyia yanbarensis]
METESHEVFSANLVKENEVPMVSMDGEAHPEITLAAVGMGILVACIILITLIAYISRRKRQLFDNMKSASGSLSASRKSNNSGSEVFTISNQIQSHSCRSSTVTVCTDVVTQI